MGIARIGGMGSSPARTREDIAAVIERDELTPVFQPIVDLRTGLVAGYEALARFTRGQRRNVNEWFEDAHRHGIGLRLEAHAAAMALGVARRPFGAFLAINVSASALVSSDLQAVLPARLDGIVLELTGVGASPSDEMLRATRAEVQARGGRIALALAGSDYAGLRELMWAAPDILKLDRALVARVHADRAKAALVESMVHYARDLGITVCACGVETLADLEILADLDVTYAQGNAVGRPTRPWAGVDPDAARLCTSSLSACVTGSSRPDRHALGHDGRLQWLAWRLSEATTYGDLAGAVGAIQDELGADDITLSAIEGSELVVVGASGLDTLDTRIAIADYPETERLLREQDSVQVLINDPDADPEEVRLLQELGYRSMLMLPVCCAGRAIGLFEAYSREGRPFSRFEIGRARIITLQLGATLERISRTA
jgi:EAL domain-containing protein (putative c-di-GMP-specific phosphodiesterase class I)